MIPAALKSRIDALPPAVRVEARQSVVATLDAARMEFARGDLDERGLIAVALAVNAALDDLPFDGTSDDERRIFGARADAALRERLAELDRGAP